MKNAVRNAMVMLSALGVLFTGCNKDDDGGSTDPEVTLLEVPTTYEFGKDGSSSVAYSGQTERLNQLGEIKAVLKTGDFGIALSAQTLLDMYSNRDGNGGGHFSFSSEKDLKSKTFALDQDYFEDLMVAAEEASLLGSVGITAANGSAGLLIRNSNGTSILVDENGFEFTQIIEKGLMGAVIMNQILNNYLTDDLVGDAVENTLLEEGKNYTAREHHWDEAFGYFGVPADFRSNWPESREDEVRFWGEYCNGRDALLGANDVLMGAFLRGRTAIVNDDSQARDTQRKILFAGFQQIAAATAIHYLNEALAADNDGDRLHVLSEAHAFIRALRYCDLSERILTNPQIDAMLDTDLGTNFWTVTVTGLNNAKKTLASEFNLERVKDLL